MAANATPRAVTDAILIDWRIGRLRFDFFLDDRNIAIEYNGRQHYQAIEYFGGDSGFETTVSRDNSKRKWCESSGVKLVVVPYGAVVDTYLDEALNGLL